MNVLPTRSAFLELREERYAMQEGFRFLDEKRLLLAAKIMQLIKSYQELRNRFIMAHTKATADVHQSIHCHGLEEMLLLPVLPGSFTGTPKKSDFFGVPLLESATFTIQQHKQMGGPLFSSAEQQACLESALTLPAVTLELAISSGNLQRLMLEYHRTERQARSLEEVILPELDKTLHDLESQLDEAEQEEALRVRFKKQDNPKALGCHHSASLEFH